MFLKLKKFCGILFHPEESISLSIVHVGPYLVALVCIPPYIDYLFRVYLIFWFGQYCVNYCTVHPLKLLLQYIIITVLITPIILYC